MKKFLAIFAIAGLVASCESGTSKTPNTDSIEKAKKDSIEAATNAAKDTLNAKKDSLTVDANAKKDSVEAAHK